MGSGTVREALFSCLWAAPRELNGVGCWVKHLSGLDKWLCPSPWLSCKLPEYSNNYRSMHSDLSTDEQSAVREATMQGHKASSADTKWTVGSCRGDESLRQDPSASTTGKNHVLTAREQIQSLQLHFQHLAPGLADCRCSAKIYCMDTPGETRKKTNK